MQRFKYVFLFLASFYMVSVYAERYSHPTESIWFNIVKEDFVFDFNSIERATILERQNGQFDGLQIDLKPAAAETLARMTDANIGKRILVIFNNKVISTTLLRNQLGQRLILTGLTLAEARLFLTNLQSLKTTQESGGSAPTILRQMNEIPQLIR